MENLWVQTYTSHLFALYHIDLRQRKFIAAAKVHVQIRAKLRVVLKTTY